MFYPYKNPPQWLLDGLLAEAAKGASSCPDCAVKSGEPHDENCDVARCIKTGGQRLICHCGDCGDDLWSGLWPGVQEAYDQRLVCFANDVEPIGGHVCFDLNEVARRGLLRAKSPK